MSNKKAITTAELPAKQSRTLYEISKEYSSLEELFDSIEGEISPDQQAQIDEFLDGLGEERDKKVDAYCGLIRDLQGRAEIRKKEADRFAQLAKWDANKADRLKGVLLNFLQLHDVQKIETDKFRVRRAVNGNQAVIVGERYVEFPEELEERFRTVIFKPNLTEIKKALKDGEKLDFASFGDKGENLRIE